MLRGCRDLALIAWKATAFEPRQQAAAENAHERGAEAGNPSQSESRISDPSPFVIDPEIRRPTVSPNPVENASKPAISKLELATNQTPSAVVVALPPARRAVESTQLLQQWEGTVISVGPKDFRVHLRDLRQPERPDETATIAREHVQDEDLPLAVPGAIFYWSIGYRIKVHGQKKLESGIRFQRLPVWTRTELERAAEFASEYTDVFSDSDKE